MENEIYVLRENSAAHQQRHDSTLEESFCFLTLLFGEQEMPKSLSFTRV